MERWQHALNDISADIHKDEHEHDDDRTGGSIETRDLSNINFGSYMLMATFLAEKMRHLLSLVVHPSSSSDDESNQHNHQHRHRSSGIMDSKGRNSVRKVGVSIPEGPFLPLYVLTVHSLNVAVCEGWLCASDNDNRTDAHKLNRRCEGVAIIPMEADEAPERLKHMLADSHPDLILVAPGKDWESMHAATLPIQSTSQDECRSSRSSIQLVDFSRLAEEAQTSLSMHIEQANKLGVSLMELLWPPEIRTDAIDSLRYPHSVHECFDVARLVALGLVRLSSPNFVGSSPTTLLSQQCKQRRILSHIVYTSGTTGKPKGCVSSLASLQHYIRAKNLAHAIDSQSRVLLASAITFDPCFSDILAVCVANATLCVATRERLYSREDDDDTCKDDHCGDGKQGRYHGLTNLLRQLAISHVLCTPALWATVEGYPPENVPSLKVVALGGEPIPRAIVRKWARRKRTANNGGWNREYPRLCATYGVTEVCVYQTFGEVVLEEDACSDRVVVNKTASSPGHHVGLHLFGTNIHICRPYPEDDECADKMNVPLLERVEPDESSEPAIGEVVLSGSQVDSISSYLNLDEISARVFVRCDDGEAGFRNDSYFYRTGDLGYIEPSSGNLHILGRIKGDNMVKINGVRIELSEIEHAIIDEDEDRLIIDCIATLLCASTNSADDEREHKQLVAYCLLSSTGISQLGIAPEVLKTGVIVSPGPLMYLLRARCDGKVRKGCTPSFFVLIDRIPLSPTGKRCRSTLPELSNCTMMNASLNGLENFNLWDSSNVGSIVADTICECLNLQPWQRQLITLSKSV